jgi:hypothetical protein
MKTSKLKTAARKVLLFFAYMVVTPSFFIGWITVKLCLLVSAVGELLMLNPKGTKSRFKEALTQW